MASASKHGKLSSADKAAGIVFKLHHFGRRVSNGGLSRFLLGRKGECFEVFRCGGRILGHPLLVCIDGGNPKVRGSVVVYSGRQQDPRVNPFWLLPRNNARSTSIVRWRDTICSRKVTLFGFFRDLISKKLFHKHGSLGRDWPRRRRLSSSKADIPPNVWVHRTKGVVIVD